jgi:hypothetical protein
VPAALTLYTDDHHWRVEIEAHSVDLKYFKRIGTHVSVYRKSRTTTMWGSMSETDWDPAPAQFIHINNLYRGAGPEVGVREEEWHNAALADLSQRGVGDELFLPAGQLPRDWLAGSLNICEVESIVTVIIEGETLTGVVSASSAPWKRQVPAA